VNGRRGESGNWRKSSRSIANGQCVEVGAGYRKSSRSHANGNCVEVASGYRKSSASVGNGNCLEAASAQRTVLVRDTTDRKGTVLAFPAQAWSAFAAALRGAS